MVLKAGARRAIGSLIICVFLLIYIVAAVSLSARLPMDQPMLVLAYYAFAGIIWVFPLAPVFAWMSRAPLTDP